MGDENPIRTLRDYSKPSHKGYRNTIKLPVGNNVVPLRSDTIRLVQNGCSFYGLRSEDPNQHLKDFLKFVDSPDLDGANRERMRLRLQNSVIAMDSFQGLTPKVPHHGIDLWLQDLSLYDNESWNDLRDFTKPVKAIALPQDVPSTSDRRLIELENQVQRLMEAHLALTQSNLEELVSHFMASQDARLSKFEADFKQQQSEMTNKIDTVLKAITDQIARTLPSDTLERKDITDVDNLGPDRDDEEIKWLDVEGPLDLVDTSEESVYELLIKEMPKCSLNYDFKIKKGDLRNLKIPFMIGHKFMANAYIDVDLPMNIISLAYYNSIRKNGYVYIGRNFVGLGRDMHVFVGNMSYVMDFTILESIETDIDPSLSSVVFGRPFVEIACLAINSKYGLMTFTDVIKEITFKTPYKDPQRSELSSEGHDLLSSRVILSEDDNDRGCRKPSDLEDGFYKDTIKLEPEYLTEMDDE
ncbi:hypothetical protein Tco_1490782 [Tanacetum coccineum]